MKQQTEQLKTKKGEKNAIGKNCNWNYDENEWKRDVDSQVEAFPHSSRFPLAAELIDRHSIENKVLDSFYFLFSFSSVFYFQLNTPCHADCAPIVTCQCRQQFCSSHRFFFNRHIRRRLKEFSAINLTTFSLAKIIDLTQELNWWALTRWNYKSIENASRIVALSLLSIVDLKNVCKVAMIKTTKSVIIWTAHKCRWIDVKINSFVWWSTRLPLLSIRLIDGNWICCCERKSYWIVLNARRQKQ